MARDKPVVPVAGEVLKTTERMNLRILGYQATGEVRRLESPAGKVMTAQDSTEVWLPPGTKMLVREVSIYRYQNGGREVWVRVEPYP